MAKRQLVQGKDSVVAQRPIRVLIVEDEAIIALELEMMLQHFGADVLGIAMSAAEALEAASALCPDCITMDINLKGDRDGIDAALDIYRDLGIRVIFVSAYSSDDMKARAEPAKPYGWVQKPIQESHLERALALIR